MFKFANPLGFHEVNRLRYCTLGIGLLFACLASSTYAQSDASSINFGDDSSNWANAQECDDPRFAGDGMAPTLADTDRCTTPLIAENSFLQDLFALLKTPLRLTMAA
jgi:hypothetical protein